MLGLLLLWWAYKTAGGFGPILSQPSAFEPGQPKAGQFFKYFVPALTGMIGFWATLSLNIPDFSRYAKTQRDQILGQALGLPATMALYSFIGVAVTSATTIIYGKTLWDPVDVLTHFKSPVVLIVAMLALCIATLATNIAANVVSPANDFAHLAPRFISFRVGGFITGVIGILMMPWKLIANPESYIFDWLIGYGALLGPIGGILIADYFVFRRRVLNLADLYRAEGEYRYTNGFSITGAVGVRPRGPAEASGVLVQGKRIDAVSGAAVLVNLTVRLVEASNPFAVTVGRTARASSDARASEYSLPKLAPCTTLVCVRRNSFAGSTDFETSPSRRRRGRETGMGTERFRR